jgi:type IV fimbrial biogenesis protein FimT
MRRHLSGFTLLEAAFVLAVTAIIMSVAIPSYAHYQQRQQLRQAADALTQDLRNARELSVGSSQPIYINYRPGRAWCWGISRGQPCDCAGISPMPVCNIRTTDSKLFPDVTLDSAQDIELSPQLGRVARAGNAAMRNRQGNSLKVVMNPMGRVSICGPDSNGGSPC